ncbi:hypothetical protein [Anaerolentibacter hominis]|uniref:hypothetical protein n=1 Tax=Anaerolentibacter hominis TaxID=3079009 RepID=UPI0031B87D7F
MSIKIGKNTVSGSSSPTARSEIIKLNSYQEWEDMKIAGTLADDKYYATPESDATVLIDDAAVRTDKTYSSKKIDEIKGDLDTAIQAGKTNITTLASRVDSAETSIAGLIGTVNAVNEKVTTLQTKVSQVTTLQKLYYNQAIPIDASTLFYRLSDEWITDKTFANIVLTSESIPIAQVAGLKAHTENGAIVFRAEKVPAGSIVCNITLTKGVA